MTERLLQFIWQFQYFNKQSLATTDGTPLHILSPGQFNSNQGPDFSEGKIKLGNTIWAGNIELHVKASDWLTHKHQADRNYQNIILHIVWQNDREIADATGTPLPTLELQPQVPVIMLEKYALLMQHTGFVPCENFLPALSGIAWFSWKERLAVERLMRKSKDVLFLLRQSNNHWEEVFWQMLAKNFGIPVNAEVFQNISKAVSINILARHKNQLHQLEALLLGLAGLLDDDFKEDYPQMLQKEYRYLAKKYVLQQVTLAPSFLRMRPANFPTLRLAQLAMLIHQSSHLFSRIKETQSISEVQEMFTVTANDYWHYHYVFDQPAPYTAKRLGRQMVNNIIINTVIPILFAYGVEHNN
ncbi:MAG TPA: DUF2851 family protein, partial [Chitinophagaceae bacterium]|nr:DUF2851 family protein [Chitinophagaceae bacterium]